MTTPTTIGRLGLVGALVVSCACAQAMDLRDMPNWVRDRIWPVEIDWAAMGGEQTAEMTGIHIWGAPTVTTPGGGVTVAAPGFATGGGVTVGTMGFGEVGGVGVRLPGNL